MVENQRLKLKWRMRWQIKLLISAAQSPIVFNGVAGEEICLRICWCASGGALGRKSSLSQCAFFCLPRDVSLILRGWLCRRDGRDTVKRIALKKEKKNALPTTFEFGTVHTVHSYKGRGCILCPTWHCLPCLGHIKQNVNMNVQCKCRIHSST